MALKKILKSITPDWIRQRILKGYYLSKLKQYLANDQFEALDGDLKAIRQIVRRGDTVVDIGANFGLYALFLSRIVGDRGHVYAVEPVPLTYDILCHNITRLKLTNVSFFNCAISEKNGRGTMVVPEYETGEGDNYYQASLMPNGQANSSHRSFPVQSKTVDSLFLDDVKKIDFVKIDVEGHELQVVRGAAGLIKKCKPVLFIEISSDPDRIGSSANTLFGILERHGYAPYWYDGVELKIRNRGDKSINYFFLTADRRRWPICRTEAGAAAEGRTKKDPSR